MTTLDTTQLSSLQAVFGAEVPADVGQALKMLDASPSAPLDAAARAALREAAAGKLRDGEPAAGTRRAMPAGLALQLAQLTGADAAPAGGPQLGLTKRQAAALLALGVAQDDLPRVRAGEVVVALLPTGTGDDTIGTVQVADDHIKSAIISIHDEGNGLRSMGHFRERAYDVARAFGRPELELGGAAVINGKIEALLKRQGFELSTRPVPDDLGDDGDMELYSKRLKVPEARS